MDGFKGYSDKLFELQGNEQVLAGMKSNAAKSTEKYSADKMAGDFSAGVLRPLRLAY